MFFFLSNYLSLKKIEKIKYNGIKNKNLIHILIKCKIEVACILNSNNSIYKFLFFLFMAILVENQKSHNIKLFYLIRKKDNFIKKNLNYVQS
jgi:hypothetical protein